MNIEITKLDWFPANVFYCDLDELRMQELINLVEKEKTNWKKNLNAVKAHTSGFTGLRYPIIEDLSNFIRFEILPEIEKNMEWRTEENHEWMCWEAWINYYQKGDKAELHNHTLVDYCAVLIVQPGEDSLIFHDYSSVNGLTGRFEKRRTEIIREKKGRLFFFPPWLHHEVKESPVERITVAFNFLNKHKDLI